MRMRRFVICGLPRSKMFFHIISQTTLFPGGGVTVRKICVLIFSTIFDWNIFHSKKNYARYDQT
jgi:hypothetical protein